MDFAFPSRVTPHSVGRCHVVTEGTAAVSGGGGVSRRMRWKAGNKYVVYFMVLNAPTPHQSLRDSFPSRGSQETPQHSQKNQKTGCLNFETACLIFCDYSSVASVGASSAGASSAGAAVSSLAS